jgi:hypothetical protein
VSTQRLLKAARIAKAVRPCPSTGSSFSLRVGSWTKYTGIRDRVTGAFGVLHYVRDPCSGELAAVKVMSLDMDGGERN